MAKRAPAGEIAYNPLDMTLAQSVVKGAQTAQDGKTSPEERIGEGASEDSLHGSPGSSNGNIVDLSKASRSDLVPKTTIRRSLNREKRVLLTPDEERQVERLVDRIGEQLGTSLKLSHLLRACMAVLCHAEPELLRLSAELRPLPRPANGDAVALAQFEQALAKLLSKSLRDAPAIR